MMLSLGLCLGLKAKIFGLGFELTLALQPVALVLALTLLCLSLALYLIALLTSLVLEDNM